MIVHFFIQAMTEEPTLGFEKEGGTSVLCPAPNLSRNLPGGFSADCHASTDPRKLVVKEGKRRSHVMEALRYQSSVFHVSGQEPEGAPG